MPAEERVQIFRTAWDLVGSGLGGRNELYERFYLASSARMYQVAQMVSAREADNALLDSVLSGTL
jgi:4-hydroxyphenylacetate 3-monooxygenase